MPAPARFDVDVRVTRDLRHAPYLLDGLAELEDGGEVRLKLSPRWPRRHDRVVLGPDGPRRVARPYPWSLDLAITDHGTGRRTKVSVDLQDWRDMYSATSLAASDVILKRMCTRPEVDQVEAAYGVSVRPAGITASGDASRWSSPWSMRVAALFGQVESVLDAPRDVLGRRRARRRYEAVQEHEATASRLPDLPEDYVLYQVVHQPWLGRPAADRMNEARIELVRALREELGTRFVGGMTFPGEVPAGWEDCRSELFSSREVYLDLVRGAAVVVASNGFGGSPPWKLAEYLELGCCIVAEPPEVVLPQPLEHGVHAWLADSAQEVARACRHLVDAPDERAGLRQGAATYHRDQVSPAALARRVLDAGAEVAPCPA
jgi:glycosyltransferase involved in cell wall biosynthesis